MADFSAFDTDFNPAYSTAFLSHIAAAEKCSSNNQLKDVQAQATQNTNKKAKECRAMYQGMKYYIQKAFPANTGVWAEFGYNTYKSNNIVIEKLIQFMVNLHEASQKYQAQLTAVDFTPTHTANIQTLGNQLLALNTEKNMSKGTRSSTISQRIALLNKIWQITEQICHAGKTMYYNNYGKYQLFLLPWVKAKPKVKALPNDE